MKAILLGILGGEIASLFSGWLTAGRPREAFGLLVAYY